MFFHSLYFVADRPSSPIRAGFPLRHFESHATLHYTQHRPATTSGYGDPRNSTFGRVFEHSYAQRPRTDYCTRKQYDLRLFGNAQKAHGGRAWHQMESEQSMHVPARNSTQSVVLKSTGNPEHGVCYFHEWSTVVSDHIVSILFVDGHSFVSAHAGRSPLTKICGTSGCVQQSAHSAKWMESWKVSHWTKLFCCFSRWKYTHHLKLTLFCCVGNAMYTEEPQKERDEASYEPTRHTRTLTKLRFQQSSPSFSRILRHCPKFHASPSACCSFHRSSHLLCYTSSQSPTHTHLRLASIWHIIEPT